VEARMPKAWELLNKKADVPRANRNKPEKEV
jgi:hypothetical protein